MPMNADPVRGISRRTLMARLLSCVALSPLAVQASEQQAHETDFFKGKTITLITSTGVGGAYDVVARLIARHMGRHIPGNPTIIVQNMPGGGNVLATNYLYNIAPRDGTAIATIHSAIPLQQVLGTTGVRFAADKFNWLGSTGSQNEVILVWHTAGVTTMAQAEQKPVLVGGTGAAAGMTLLPEVINYLLGTKFKIVMGYRTSEDVNLGIERGEVQARAFSIGSITSQHPDWISAHKVNFLAQSGARRDKLLPDVPLLTELAKNEEQRAIFKLIASAPALGQPYVAPPEVPVERLAILRDAFAATLRDPAFLADAAKIRFDIEPMSADEIAKIVHETVAAPPDIIAKAKTAMGLAADR
jgi:tripartite-type tricarboxylate transporter receptor subunit TctC